MSMHTIVTLRGEPYLTAECSGILSLPCGKVSKPSTDHASLTHSLLSCDGLLGTLFMLTLKDCCNGLCGHPLKLITVPKP